MVCRFISGGTELSDSITGMECFDYLRDCDSYCDLWGVVLIKTEPQNLPQHLRKMSPFFYIDILQLMLLY
jgi:hypothetical protein